MTAATRERIAELQDAARRAHRRRQESVAIAEEILAKPNTGWCEPRRRDEVLFLARAFLELAASSGWARERATRGGDDE